MDAKVFIVFFFINVNQPLHFYGWPPPGDTVKGDPQTQSSTIASAERISTCAVRIHLARALLGDLSPLDKRHASRREQRAAPPTRPPTSATVRTSAYTIPKNTITAATHVAPAAGCIAGGAFLYSVVPHKKTDPALLPPPPSPLPPPSLPNLIWHRRLKEPNKDSAGRHHLHLSRRRRNRLCHLLGRGRFLPCERLATAKLLDGERKHD